MGNKDNTATNRIYHMGSGYGTELKSQPTVAEAMRIAGIDNKIVKRPITAIMEEGVHIPFEKKAMTIECLPDDNFNPLGVVGADYAICQNMDAVAVAIELEKLGKFTVQSVCRLKNGARVMLTGKVDEHVITRIDGTPDPMSSHFVFSNAHDGQGSVIMGLTHLRHVCNNQNVAMMKGLKHEIRLTHTGNLEDRVAEAQAMLMKGETELAKARAVFQKLADTRMTKKQYRDFAANLLDSVKGSYEEADGQKDARESKEARAKSIEELEGFFNNGAGNTGETKWDAFNSITDWLDNKLGRMDAAKRTQEKYLTNFASSAFGQNRSTKGRALRALTAKK